MKYKTRKQELYFDEVIRLRQEFGYGEDRISKILPIGHTTVSRWLGIFAAEQQSKSKPKSMGASKNKQMEEQPAITKDVKALEAEIQRLRAQLKYESLRAEAYDELINVAESQFNISIRKKAGVKR